MYNTYVCNLMCLDTRVYISEVFSTIKSGGTSVTPRHVLVHLGVFPATAVALIFPVPHLILKDFLPFAVFGWHFRVSYKWNLIG